MSVEASALVLAWVVIALLTLGMAALHQRVTELALIVGKGYALPPRARPGDRIELPPHVREGSSRFTVIVFADASCRSCAAVVTALTDAGASFRLVVLWRANAGAAGGVDDSYADQEAVFDQFNVTVTPFVLCLDGDVVVASGHCGSAAEAVELVSQLRTGADAVVPVV